MRPEERKNILLLNLKKYLEPKMRKKLDPATQWNYLNFPESGMQADGLSVMRSFIDYHLDKFIEHCIIVLPYFSEADSDSIGTNNQTTLAVSFINLFSYLEENGFPGPKQFARPLNFWSGKVARVKAFQDTRGVSDSGLPSISVMFDLCQSIREIQGNYDSYILTLNTATSRVFAIHARGVANVYLSSEKISEEAGLTSHNGFWLTELPELMRLYQLGLVQDIVIHLYNHHSNTWNNGVSIFSGDGKNIRIYRRDFNFSHDKLENKNRFKKSNATSAESAQWIASEPRPSITYGCLKEIAKTWRDRTRKKIAGKETQGIYWGTFDPPTLAHLNIIVESLRQFHFSNLFVVINDNSGTGKTYQSTASERAMMFENMLAEYAKEMSFSDEWMSPIQISCQTDVNDFSYQKVKQTHPDKKIYAIVGQDSFDKFKQCKKSLRSYDHILIAPRGSESRHLAEEIRTFGLPNISVLVIDRSCLEISSTNAREAIYADQRDITRTQLHPSVITIIQKHGLFAVKVAQKPESKTITPGAMATQTSF